MLVRVEPDMPAEVLSLAPHPDGALWVGTSFGLFLVYGDGRAERYTTREGLPGDFISTLLSDDERLWVGTTRGGLAVMTPAVPHGKFAVSRVLTVADGLPSSWVNEIRKTSDGALWVATDAGLARLRQDARARRA
jgi:ligand-binding sensor domain-containing protein